MNTNIWYDYQNKFKCKISMVEPNGNYVLYVNETGKLYDISEFTDEELENAMKKSISQNKDVFFQMFAKKETETVTTPQGVLW